MNHFLTGIMFCFISYTLHAAEKITPLVNYHTIASLGGKCIVALTAEIDAHNNLKNHLTSLERYFPSKFEQYKNSTEPKRTIQLAQALQTYDESTNVLLQTYNYTCNNRSQTKKMLCYNMSKFNDTNATYGTYIQNNLTIAISQFRQFEKSYHDHIQFLATTDPLLQTKINERRSTPKLVSKAIKRHPNDQYLISYRRNLHSHDARLSAIMEECESYAMQAYANNLNIDFLGNYLQMIDAEFPEFKELNAIN